MSSPVGRIASSSDLRLSEEAREERELLYVEGDGLADVAPSLPVLQRSEEEAARRLRAVRAACVCVGWGRGGLAARGVQDYRKGEDWTFGAGRSCCGLLCGALLFCVPFALALSDEDGSISS